MMDDYDRYEIEQDDRRSRKRDMDKLKHDLWHGPENQDDDCSFCWPDEDESEEKDNG